MLISSCHNYHNYHNSQANRRETEKKLSFLAKHSAPKGELHQFYRGNTAVLLHCCIVKPFVAPEGAAYCKVRLTTSSDVS